MKIINFRASEKELRIINAIKQTEKKNTSDVIRMVISEAGLRRGILPKLIFGFENEVKDE